LSIYVEKVFVECCPRWNAWILQRHSGIV